MFAGSRRVGDVASTVTGRHEGAVAAVAGVLVAPLSSAVLPVSQAARSVSAAATVAGGALRLFAAAVATYNAGVDELNRRFDAARAAGFNSEPVTAAPGESLTAADERRYDHRVSEAKTRLVFELGLHVVPAVGDVGTGLLWQGVKDGADRTWDGVTDGADWAWGGVTDAADSA